MYTPYIYTVYTHQLNSYTQFTYIDIAYTWHPLQHNTLNYKLYAHPLPYTPTYLQTFTAYTHNQNNNKYSVPHISLLPLHQRIYHYISTQHNPYWKLNTTSTLRLTTPLYDSLQHTTNTTPTHSTNHQQKDTTKNPNSTTQYDIYNITPSEKWSKTTYLPYTYILIKNLFHKALPLLLYNISTSKRYRPTVLYLSFFIFPNIQWHDITVLKTYINIPHVDFSTYFV